jgi:trigger factor
LRGKALAKTQERLNVTQSKLPGSQVSLEIEIPGVRSQQVYEKVITTYMRSAQIPGFRRGKIPRQVVMQRIGAVQLKAAALEDLIQESFEAAIKQEAIKALGGIQLQSSMETLVAQFEPGNALTFAISVEVPPEVSIQKYQGFEVTAVEAKYDAAKIDAVLADHQSQQATLVPVEDRAAEPGDVAQIDFTSRFEDPKAGDEDTEDTEEVKDFQLELIANGLITDLVNGVIGMSVGETKEIPVTFPDDFFQEEWAGRSALFTVTLNDIKSKELPELNDDFAQDISEFSTLAELRAFLEERYQKEAADETAANIESALLEALVAELEVEPPESMIRDETNIMINETAAQLQSQGIDVKKLLTKEVIPGMQERLRPEAIDRLKTTLALAEVAKLESISVDAEALDKRIQEVRQSFGDQQFDPQRLRNVLEEELLKETVVNWLKEHSDVKLVDALPDESKQTEKPQAKAKAAPKSKKAKTKEPAAKDQVVDVASEAVEETEPQADAKPAKAARKSTSKTTKAKTATEEAEVPKDKPKTARKSTSPAKPKASRAKKAPPADDASS